MPLSGWVVFISIIGATFGVFAVEQYRVGMHETRLEKLEIKYEESSRLLHRIDQKMDSLQHQFEKRYTSP
ncbi:hypothetical protein [Ereboglobus luteus]|uniref:Uncharacterized protein n=1 Tax=Ereboglobus luteus TaxID=1796921 RepID=A0A2U8E5U4_9BACT|nr:hypothetical protein [Ereboglobus luteus]AWI10309.1 hypothetical protein CKA38_14545 [Ereboglobus luteus]